MQKYHACLNYVRDFIPKLFEKIMKYRQAMKEEPFRWSTEVAQQVRNLKTKAQSLPPIAPLYGGRFILSTDASSDTWVAVLLKKENKEEKIYAFTSN
ncbi:hypothetical protein AMTRI_Chr09g18690 [Amborella trichopoda]